VAVEFALISTVLFLILFGIIEFGRTYSQYEVMQSAAREGARAAAVGATASAVEDAVENAADPYELTNTPAVDKQCTEDAAGQNVTVSWSQNFEISIPFIPAATITRTIKGVFRCE
jgi:Flp pilus assembly protein TadG